MEIFILLIANYYIVANKCKNNSACHSVDFFKNLKIFIKYYLLNAFKTYVL